MKQMPIIPSTPDIQSLISAPLSDADLEKYLGISAEEIIKYSDLKNYSKIQELLPSDKTFKIILIEDKLNSGHWVAIMRYGNTFEYFNSYGGKWDTEWKFINRMIRVILGENSNELTRLMKQAEKDGFETIWNHHRFQKLSSKIQTCGRWVVLRISMMLMNYNLKEFTEFVLDKSKQMKKTLDYLVTKMVNE